MSDPVDANGDSADGSNGGVGRWKVSLLTKIFVGMILGIVDQAEPKK